jgi:seryl-tRNA synthetase
VIGEADRINQQRNSSSKEIGALMQAGKRDEAEAKKAEVAGLKRKTIELEKQRDEAETKCAICCRHCRIFRQDVPVGADEAANVEISRWGEPREFDFEPKDHVDLGESLGILGFGTRDENRRFALCDFNGAGARLERALCQFYARRSHDRTRLHGNLPPFIVNRKSAFRHEQLPKFEGRFVSH